MLCVRKIDCLEAINSFWGGNSFTAMNLKTIVVEH